MGQCDQFLLQKPRFVRRRVGAVQGRETHAQGLNVGVFTQAQNLPVVRRADGETVFMVRNIEAAIAGLKAQWHVPGLQDRPVVAGEKRQEQLAFQQGVG
ncbi:hypothetical protein D3C79_739450 [compost metagenome]